MGGVNAVDVAQQVHQGALRKHGCMKSDNVLQYRFPLPTGDCIEGLYIDDHLVVGVVLKSERY